MRLFFCAINHKRNNNIDKKPQCLYEMLCTFTLSNGQGNTDALRAVQFNFIEELCGRRVCNHIPDRR